MSEYEENYRGHVIYTHASGPTGGPWVASYSVWKIESNNSYQAVLQDSISDVFETIESAHSAANVEARVKLDA